MSKAYKNFWSLNVDEAVVTGILRDETIKDVEVLMPMNAQMKGVDLVLMNVKNKKSLTLQVKGSKAYEPKSRELKKFKEGSGGWFFFSTDVVKKSVADFFIFLVYVIEQSERDGRRYIMPHTITISSENLNKKTKNKKVESKNRYKFFFWMKPKAKKAYDTLDNHEYSKYGNEYSEYLDKKGFEELNQKLGN